MSRGLVQPQFPNAPSKYDQRFMAEIVRAFSVFLRQVNNPGPWQASELALPDLHQDNFELRIGDIFQHGDELRITVANKPYPRGSAAIGAVGSVTVSTP
tara:strand:- start:1124 stop:1420 length:297 start_codon:yes stop_codon:yes gene_type:complete